MNCSHFFSSPVAQTVPLWPLPSQQSWASPNQQSWAQAACEPTRRPDALEGHLALSLPVGFSSANSTCVHHKS